MNSDFIFYTMIAFLFYWIGTYSGRAKARLAGYQEGLTKGQHQTASAIREQIELAKMSGRDEGKAEARQEFIKMVVNFFEEGIDALKPQLANQIIQIKKEECETCSN